jgi:hypothetical protein
MAGYLIRAIPLLNVDGSLREWVGVHTDARRENSSKYLTANINIISLIIPLPLIDCFKGRI